MFLYWNIALCSLQFEMFAYICINYLKDQLPFFYLLFLDFNFPLIYFIWSFYAPDPAWYSNETVRLSVCPRFIVHVSFIMTGLIISNSLLPDLLSRNIIFMLHFSGEQSTIRKHFISNQNLLRLKHRPMLRTLETHYTCTAKSKHTCISLPFTDTSI